MSKKKLLIVTGCGASIDFGMPRVADVNQIFETNSRRYVLSNDPQTTLYQWICNQANNANYEELLYIIEVLAGYLNSANSYLSNFLQPNNLPLVNDTVLHHNNQTITSFDLSSLYSCFVDSLLDDFREKSKNSIANNTAIFSSLQSFLLCLNQEFDISYVTTNHDNILLSALPNNVTGFDTNGSFDRSILMNNPNWNYGIHLHGSVHFDMTGNIQRGYNMHEIRWNNDLFSNFSSNASGRNWIFTRQGNPLPHSSIIAGIDKTNQILQQPFLSYYMILDKLIFESDAILFIGYGFQDDHLNNAFEFIRYDWNKIRKVAVVDYSDNNTASLYGGRYDDWTMGLSKTIPFDSFNMGDGTKSLRKKHPIVAGYRQSCSVEKSSDSSHPLAIWYNGFTEACNYPHVILNELL